MKECSGYAHPEYALSLREFGRPRKMPGCGGWVLVKPIPGTINYDASGCYPVFACLDWSQLEADLNDMGDELVCISLVTDPFGEYERNYLERCFKDIVIPFKQHYVVDLSLASDDSPSRHHRRYARKALSQLHVQKCEEPALVTDEWVGLYQNLILRHNIRGISAFSKSSFERQLTVPGTVVFRAVYGEKTVGMTIWYGCGERSYYHLGAYSPEGYDLRASYGLFRFAIEYFSAAGIRWLDLGAGAGLQNDGMDGLSRFKQGWSTGTRTAYFCGRVFSREKYTHIVNTRSITAEDYFPAYRKGEFA